MKSPFKFLDSYTKDDREIFFGREREIEELYHRVFESKIMLVYGVSGTGKSSLIHCGLANKFSATDWLPLVIRRGGNILDSMASAIKAASITQQAGEIVTANQFKKSVRSLYLDHYKPVFFIFDQFEELFIFGNKEEKNAVVQLIKALIESEIQCRFIFVMREEYMAEITEFEKHIPTIFANRVRIEKMAHINAIEAINGPCKIANISLDEGFAETLLEKLSPDSADVELTYLQVFLDRILRLASMNYPPLVGGGLGGVDTPTQEDNLKVSFTISLLSQVGNVSDLLGSFLDEQISLLGDPETGLAALKSFVSIKGTRRQMGPEQVIEYAQTLGKPITDSILQEMLLTFINLRILRDKDQNGKYELRHDGLATKIYEKITLLEREILEIRQFIENAYGTWQKRGLYLSADDLSYIAPYETRLYLSKELSGFVEDSKNALTRAKRRRRNLVFAATIALLTAFAGFTVWALKEKSNADIASIRQLESILKLNENFAKVKINQEKRKDEIYRQFEMRYLTAPLRTQPLWDAAQRIKTASNELVNFIISMEYKIISKTENFSPDSVKNIDLAFVKDKSNTKIPYQVLFGRSEVSGSSNIILLKQLIVDYRKTIFNQFDKKDFDKIKFSIETEKTVADAKGDSVSWEEVNFKETILAGAITNLNSLITEINYIEIDAINLLYSWITSESFAFNVIRPLIIQQTPLVLSGGSYQARLMLTAYDTRMNMEAYIFNEKEGLSETAVRAASKMTPHISKDGVIDITIPAKKIGRNLFSGFISLGSYNESSKKYFFTQEYMVGNPSVYISPLNMNVLYLGVDNPIDISIPGVSSNSLRLSLSNGTVSKKDDHFLVRPLTTEDCNISVTIINDDKSLSSTAPFRFIVKNKPIPVASIKGIIEDKIKKVEPLSAKELIAAYPSDFDFGVSFEVTGFTVATIRDGLMVSATSNSNLFTDEQRKLIPPLRRGDKLYIQDIRVKGSDGSVLSLKGLIYTID